MEDVSKSAPMLLVATIALACWDLTWMKTASTAQVHVNAFIGLMSDICMSSIQMWMNAE